MCVVSMVGDYWKDNYPTKYPKIYDTITTTTGPLILPPEVTKAEHEALKKEIASLKKDMKELKKLLKAAKIYDEKTDQHECETEDKIALIKKLADLVGVDLKDVLG